jgi:hypothetical protein
VGVEMDERMADVIAQFTRRIDHLERECRRWKRINAVISIGALLLLLGGVNRPGTLEAQQVRPTQEGVRAATSRSEARMRMALRGLNSIKQRIANGKGILNRDAWIHLWARRLLIAELDRSSGQADRVAAFEEYLVRMKDLEERSIAHYGERRISDLELMDAEFHRLEAESWLEMVKQGYVLWMIPIP